ncbi:MAG: low molecular weight protein arginine phosphatase [Bacillota bacterium]|nr:low molecular weight protein arginine phosphatase [Bacillota bacterium]
MKRVLFVCTGNTCRSPMAEAILKSKNVEGVEVRSAGIFASNGNDASGHAKEILTENKMNHDHQSSSLTESEIKWATIILTMTSAHKEAIILKFPNASQKTFTLKEFTGESENLDVSDPYGGDIHVYRRTFKELGDLIDKALKKI